VSTVVIGAGVNELACAHALARAGRRVLVLEGRAGEGSEAPDRGWVPPQLTRSLGLPPRVLKVECPDPWATVPLPDGGRLELSRDMGRSVEAIRRVSPRDAAKWPEFCERMQTLARLLERLYVQPPPDPMSRDAGDLAQLAVLGIRARLMGREGLEDLLRLIPMPVADWLDDWFACDALKGALGAAGILHLRQGPRSGGTAFVLLHHHVGSPVGVFRPPLSNLRQVLRALPGVEIRRGAAVARIRVRSGRADGVVLAGGEEIPAELVVSGAGARRTLLDLVDPGWHDPQIVRALTHVRRRGVVARARLALERAPECPRLVIAPSLDYLERAYDDAKRGSFSREPYLEAVSAGKGADGRSRVDAHIQYAPYALADGEWNEARRAALGILALKVLARHWPHAGASVERVESPRDLEERHGFPEGQEYHAELALDQALWMRPLPALARYRTPLTGLYLCGPGMHPGGGIAGAAGMNAARVILRDLRRASGRGTN
jgi:phytoene dehydrogenase-like protein